MIVSVGTFGLSALPIHKPPLEFKADHAFLYSIVKSNPETESDNVNLFIGYIVEPTV